MTTVKRFIDRLETSIMRKMKIRAANVIFYNSTPMNRKMICESTGPPSM